MGSRHVSSSLGAIVTYCGASMLMTLTNKAILSSYAFHVNFFLLLVQSVVTVAVLEIATALGYTSHRPFSLHDAKRWGIVSLGLIGMIYTGSKAIQYMSIPLFTVFKNLTIIMIAYGERTFFGGAPLTTVILLSFVLMVLSSVVAGWADLTSGHLVADSVSPLLSYGWMLANCLTSTIFALMMRVKIKQVNFKDYDTVFYNNLLPVPILAALTLVAERAEWRAFYATYWAAGAPRAADVPGLLVAILVSGVCGFAISFGSAWCVRVTSSTTYSMVGALNKLPIAVAGMVFFHAPVTLASVLSVLIAFAAGVLYSAAKNAAGRAATPLAGSGSGSGGSGGGGAYARLKASDAEAYDAVPAIGADGGRMAPSPRGGSSVLPLAVQDLSRSPGLRHAIPMVSVASAADAAAGGPHARAGLGLGLGLGLATSALSGLPDAAARHPLPPPPPPPLPYPSLHDKPNQE